MVILEASSSTSTSLGGPQEVLLGNLFRHSRHHLCSASHWRHVFASHRHHTERSGQHSHQCFFSTYQAYDLRMDRGRSHLPRPLRHSLQFFQSCKASRWKRPGSVTVQAAHLWPSTFIATGSQQGPTWQSMHGRHSRDRRCMHLSRRPLDY